MLRWTPIARELLIALAVAGIANLLAGHILPEAANNDFIPPRIARELVGYPYFDLGVAIIIALALFAFRSR